MIGLISIAGIAYGANYREGVEAACERLERLSELRDADAAHQPTLVAEGGQVRLKQGERALTMKAPSTSSGVDLLWLRDARGALLAASDNKKKLPEPLLLKTLNVGTQVQPFFHVTGEDVVWKGEVVTIE